MSPNAARRLSDAEVEALTAKLAARPDPGDARAPAPSRVLPLDKHRRQPLGLTPVIEEPERGGIDDGEPIVGPDGTDLRSGPFYDLRKDSREFLEDKCPPYGVVYLAVNAVVSIAYAIEKTLKEKIAGQGAKFAELQLENAQLRASLAEVKAKQNEHDFVLERLQIENKGPPGPKGERGRDGRDGKGLMGPRGEPGPRGLPAPMIVGWRIDSDRYLVTPQYGDGSSGPPLNLSAFVSDADEEGDE